MDDKQATGPRPAGRKLPWMKSAVSKKRGGEEAPAGTAAKTTATKASRPASKRTKRATKPKDDDSYIEGGEEEKAKSEEEHEEQPAPPQPQPPQAEAVSPAKSEGESPTTETRKKTITKRKAENMIKALEGKASSATEEEPARALPRGRRTAAAKSKAAEPFTKVARKAPTAEDDKEDQEEALATPPSRGGALALDELPTQADVPLLATTATQLDVIEAPTQADSPAPPPSRGRARARPSARQRSRSRSRSRSPSLSPNPVSHYLDLLEEATQPDSSAFLSPLQSSPSSSSAVPSPLNTPPRSPLSGAHTMLEAPTQFDGPPRSPFSLSPVPSPVRRGKRDTSRPAAQGRKNKKLLTSIIAAAAVSSSPSVTSTTTTPSQQRRQRQRLMSQATQPDLFALASPSASQGDSSVVYDDDDDEDEDEDLDAVLSRPTQTEDTCSPVDLLGRPTQVDGCAGGLSPIRPRGRGGARATPQPSPLGVKAGVTEDSLETSLLLLDASTQEDDVDDADCSPFQRRGGGGGSDADDDHNGDEDESDSDASPVNARSRRAAAKPRQFDSSFVLGPTQTDSPLSGSSPASHLLRAETQPDLASSTAATQLDQSEQSLLILSDSMEAESLGSIPTQIDGFALLGSAPTQADDLRQGSRYPHHHRQNDEEEDATQLDAVHGQPTQIDSLPTQLDVEPLSASTPNRKRKQKADSRSPQQQQQKQHQKPRKKRRSTDDAGAAGVMVMAEAPTLVEALHYDPTPPLDLEGESPGFEGPKSKSRKRPTSAREAADEEEEEESAASNGGRALKRRSSKEEETTTSSRGGRNRRSARQDEEEEEEEPQQEGSSKRKKARVADSSTHSRPGTGERPSPDDEDEAEAPFGRLMSLNPKYPNVVIPESGVLMGRHAECHPKCRYKGSHISTRHCRLSVVRSAAAAQGDESNGASPSLDPAPADAPLCRYGATCYRKNPQHLQQFRHPRPPPAAAPAPEFDLVVLDLSTNGTFINDTLIGKNKQRKLLSGQELSLVMSVMERPVDAKLELIAYRYER